MENPKYYFKYEGSKAVVYKIDHYWGTTLVATFTFGVDAKEYVGFKNDTDQNKGS